MTDIQKAEWKKQDELYMKKKAETELIHPGFFAGFLMGGAIVLILRVMSKGPSGLDGGDVAWSLLGGTVLGIVTNI